MIGLNILFVLCCCVTYVSSDSVDAENAQINISASSYATFVNMRTVLFKEEDACRACWNIDELNLLVARRIMQDLVPRKLPKDFGALLTYIKKNVEGLQNKGLSKKTLALMKLAMFDALGGYLHSIAIPILNEAFYAGNVDYEVTAGLRSMLAMMMSYLNTNGAGWIDPCDMSKIPTKVAALPMKMCNLEEACNAFSFHVNNTIDESSKDCVQNTVIQMPFLDDNAYPSAVAVPLKDHALFSLMSECAVNVIPKYYILAMRCLQSPQYQADDVIKFNHQLHKWIIGTVVPHLHELDRWYPGFGGVMRVVETMNQRGLASLETIKEDVKPSNRSLCIDLKPLTGNLLGIKHVKSSKGSSQISDSQDSNWPWAKLFIYACIVLLAILFLACLIWIIRVQIRKRRNRGYVSLPEEDSTLVNALTSLYCGIKTQPEKKAPRRPSSRSSNSSVGTSRSSYSEEEGTSRSSGYCIGTK